MVKKVPTIELSEIRLKPSSIWTPIQIYPDQQCLDMSGKQSKYIRTRVRPIPVNIRYTDTDTSIDIGDVRCESNRYRYQYDTDIHAE